jgi:hypothetical protein
MKKLILIAAIVLSGCATQQKIDPAFQALTEWTKTSLPQAESGQITWETRYTKGFELAAGIQNTTVRSGIRQAYSDMIPIARRFDSKQITSGEFQDIRRSTSLKIEATLNAANMEQARAQAQYNADMLQILQNNQAQQNAIYQQQMQQIQNNKTTNCTSNIYGNTVQTSCR